jgi:hypothetical protein
MTENLSETQRRIAGALELQAKRHRLDAGGRSNIGPQRAAYRKFLREEARRCKALRRAILAADPLELDAVVNAR